MKKPKFGAVLEDILHYCDEVRKTAEGRNRDGLLTDRQEFDLMCLTAELDAAKDDDFIHRTVLSEDALKDYKLSLFGFAATLPKP